MVASALAEWALRANVLKRNILVIEGGASGADQIASLVAFRKGYSAQQYPADWATFGRAAGPLRNQRMIDEGKPDVVLAFHDDIVSSRGTADCVRRALKAGIATWLYSHNAEPKRLGGSGPL